MDRHQLFHSLPNYPVHPVVVAAAVVAAVELRTKTQVVEEEIPNRRHPILRKLEAGWRPELPLE